MTDCIFCRIVRKELPSFTVYEDDKTFAFLDIKPINKGHVLVVPKNHSSDILEAEDSDLYPVISAVKKISRIVMEAVKANGVNLGVNTKPAAGQVVFHTHFHIIPRFDDDGLKHWPHKEFSNKEMEDIRSRILKETS